MKTNGLGKYQCLCCGFFTFDYTPDNSFDICSVCFWEGDGVQLDDPDYCCGANKVSLREARENFKKFGASEEVFLKHVRPPHREEFPDGEDALSINDRRRIGT